MTYDPKTPPAGRSQEGHNEKTDRLDLSSLTPNIGFHAKMVQTAMGRGFTDAMGEAGLTQMQFAILSLLRDNPGADQTTMAALLQCDRATMIAIVDRLQSRDLLTRRPSIKDKRKREISLTAAGVVLVNKAAAAIKRYDQEVSARFSSAERALFISFMQRTYRTE